MLKNNCNSLVVFESERELRPRLARRLWLNFDVLIISYIVIIIYNALGYLVNFLIMNIIIFAVLIYKTFSLRSRIIFKFEFNDESKMLHVFYNQYVFFNKAIIIPYEKLAFRYRYKIFRRGDMPRTLEIIKKNRYVGEIRENNKIGWTKEALEAIIGKLKLVSNF